jgi:xylulokinase
MATGRVIVQSRVPIAASEPRPGWSELDPEIWWHALRSASARVLRRLPRSCRIAGICIAAVTRTQIFLDRDGKLLRPAVLFRDSRAAEDSDDLARYFDTDNPADAITPFHPLARIGWLHRNETDLFDRVAAVLEPKDYLNFRLTGAMARDAVTYSRFDALRPSGSVPQWLARGLETLVAGERVMPWHKVGSVASGDEPFDALVGIPVFAGSMDSWAAAVGSGAARQGQAYDIGGTSEVVGELTARRASARGLVSLVWTEACFQLGGPTQVGADCARWAHETFRVKGGLAVAAERAGARRPDEELPLFLPYLSGERAPLWRADVRGVFLGVSRVHTGEDLLWATLEGVGFAVADVLDTSIRASGESPSEVFLSGGGARSDAWCQMKADILGLPTIRCGHAETGLLGCAMAGAVGLGIYPTIAAAAAAMSPAERVFEPRRELADFHATRAAAYQQAKAAAVAVADENRRRVRQHKPIPV